MKKFLEIIMKNSAKNVVSANIVIDSKTDKTGRSTVYLSLKQGKFKKDISTGIKWPPDFFDKTSIASEIRR
jgi:hypothetical protein